MDQNELRICAGDRVVISRPTSTQRHALRCERLATVTAVRPRSFEAGGLCFRNDGREWNGHNRVRLFHSDEPGEAAIPPAVVEAAEFADRAIENEKRVFVSSPLQTDRLKPDPEELRRVQALHAMRSRRQQPSGRVPHTKLQLVEPPPLINSNRNNPARRKQSNNAIPQHAEVVIQLAHHAP